MEQIWAINLKKQGKNDLQHIYGQRFTLNSTLCSDLTFYSILEVRKEDKY